MAELVDALVSNTSDSNIMPVRPRLRVHFLIIALFNFTALFMKTIYLKLVHLNQNKEELIGISIPYDKDLIAIAKSINCTWNPAQRCWLMPFNKENIKLIKKNFSVKSIIDNEIGQQKDIANLPMCSTLSENKTVITKNDKEQPQQLILESYINVLKRRRYSKSTVATYASFFLKFIQYYKDKSLTSITDEEIKSYLLITVEKHNFSYSTQNQIINAIKFYYEKVLGQDRNQFWIDRPRKESKLPTVLSIDEVRAIIQSISNLKHRCMIGLLYGSGLRIGELLCLRKHDINFERSQVFVRQGKGKKTG